MRYRVHGGNIKQYLGNIPQARDKLIDFSININPLGLSLKAKEAITKNISELTCYPEPDSRSLKMALGDFHRIKINNLAVGNGSIELIYLIPKALKAKKVLVITPTFSEYEFAAKSHEVQVAFFKTEEKDDFRIQLSKLRQYLSWADLVFLGNPNNPTGAYISLDDMLTLTGLCVKSNAILVVDEAFIDFVDGHEEDNLISIAATRPGLLIIRSITKFFALPGLRIGYGIGHRDFINKITSLQYPWNVNLLAQAAGEAVLKDKDYIYKSRRYVSKERRRLFHSLKAIKGLKVFPPSANFILCKLEQSSIKAARVLNARLIEKGIVIRNCDNFRGLNQKFFRVAVRRRQENLKLLMAMKQVL